MISEQLLEKLKNELTVPNNTKFPHETKKLEKHLGDFVDLFVAGEAIVAGGAVTSIFTNTEINDIDVYFRNAKMLSKFLCGVFSRECGYLKVAHMTDRSILLTDFDKLKIQLIVYKFFDSPQDIFNSFDFSVNMGAYDFKANCFVLDERFLRHNSQRYIEINTNTDYPLVSTLRVDKYREKGYKVSKAQLLSLLLRISQLNLNSWEDVLDHVGGMYGIDPEKLFNKEKEFSVQEAIEQIQSLETLEGKFIGNEPSPEEMVEKLGDKITTEASTFIAKNYIHEGELIKYCFE